jgi:hypothetical protein
MSINDLTTDDFEDLYVEVVDGFEYMIAHGTTAYDRSRNNVTAEDALDDFRDAFVDDEWQVMVDLVENNMPLFPANINRNIRNIILFI